MQQLVSYRYKGVNRLTKHKLDSEVEDILQHHGVKGMKWDKNKKKDDDEDKDEKKESSTKSEADAKLVNDIVRGNYGNGEERKKKLGKRYQELQDAVNAQLSGKSSKSKDKSKTKDKSKSKKSVKKKVKKSELKNIKKKIKPKNKKRSDGLLQQMLDLTTEGVGKLFSKFTD